MDLSTVAEDDNCGLIFWCETKGMATSRPGRNEK